MRGSLRATRPRPIIIRATFTFAGGERTAEWTETGWEWFPGGPAISPAAKPKPGDFVYVVVGVTSVPEGGGEARAWHGFMAEPVLLVAVRGETAWLHMGMWQATVGDALPADLKPTLSRYPMDRCFLRKEDAHACAHALNGGETPPETIERSIGP